MTVNLGCLHVAPRYNNSLTILQHGVATIASAGFNSVGLFVTPNYNGTVALNGRADYPGQNWSGTYTSLTTLCQDPAFVTVFANASISKFFLKTWTFVSGVFDPWRESATEAQILAEYNEFREFGIYLLQNTSNKDFIIQTSESDWAYLGTTIPETPIPDSRAGRAIAFMDARIRAIRDARIAAGPSTSRIFSAIEVNRVLDPGRRFHRDVLPYLNPDMISLSLYEAINEWVNGLNQAQSLISINQRIRDVVFSVRAEYAKTHGQICADRIPIYVGEFGWPEANGAFDNLDVAQFVTQVVETCDDINVEQVNFWQLWCNDIGPDAGLPPGVLTDQCIYKEDGSTTVQGAAVLSLL